MKQHFERYKNALDLPWESEERVAATGAYIAVLKERLHKNETDIQALCQLAAVFMEERNPCAARKLLRDFLQKQSSRCSQTDRARIAANLAYLYEDSGYPPSALHWYKKAVAWGCTLPQPYCGLGQLLLHKGENMQALTLFKKACLLAETPVNLYHVGLALYKNRQYTEALPYLQKAAACEKEELLFQNALAACYIALKQYDCAVAILQKQPFDKDNWLAADLYYLIGYYQPYLDYYYDGEDYYPDSQWLAPYYYAAKQLGQWEKAVSMHQYAMDYLNRNRVEIQQEAEHETGDDLAVSRMALRENQADLDAIVIAFKQVTSTDRKPIVELILPCMGGCQLIDCPRHQPLI